MGRPVPASDLPDQFGSNPLEAAIQVEGLTGAKADIARSIYQQESSGGRNTKTSNAGARGGMQIIPATFDRMADKGWAIDNPVHNARAGVRYINHLSGLAGDDPSLVAAGYYGGEGAIKKARNGVAVSDPRNPKAPNTLQYAQQVTSRLPSRRAVPADDLPDFENTPQVAQQDRLPQKAPKQDIIQQDKNVLGGLIRGAGSIGSTLLYPYDRIKGGGREEGLRLNKERRAAIDSGLQELIGSDPESAGYKTGKIGSEVMGTAGVGNVMAKGVQALPMLSKAIPNLAPALRSGGFSVAQKATTPAGMIGNAATRTAAGGITGYGMAGLVNPEDANQGAVWGAAMPGVVRGAGEVGLALNKGGKAVSRRLMQSALKPTQKQLKSGDARVAVDTMLDYGISPNMRGVKNLRNRLDKANDDIAALISGSKATVSRQKAVDYLSGVRADAGNQVSPTADIAAVDGIADDFLRHPNIASDAIPVQQAQALKQGTYRAIRGQYGQVRTPAIEAQKAVARGLKDQIADAVPGVGALNAEDTRLYKTLDVAERRALQEMNKNPMGLSILAGNKAAFIAFMADRSAAFKALAARSINRAAAAPGYVPKLADQLANPMLRGGLLSIPAD